MLREKEGKESKKRVGIETGHSFPQASNQPLASTRELAVVGVGGAVRPMKLFDRPPAIRKVDTLGVLDSDGKGMPPGPWPGTFKVSVIVDGA